MRPSSSRSEPTPATGLLSGLFGADEVDRKLADPAVLAAMLDVERALAEASADCGVLPRAAAVAIVEHCRADRIDLAALGPAAEAAGNPVVPLVRQLTAAVPAFARPWVHHGATSQDVLDTALVLVAVRASVPMLARLDAAAAAAAGLAERHRDTVMLARTLGQAASATTFGLKVAGWLTGLLDARARLVAVRATLPVQLGGPAGTLAALGPAGPTVTDRLAARLGLAVPGTPWHTRRQPILDLGVALGGLLVATGKLALDIGLLAQSEVAEVAEGGEPGRGGSSALPHKRNPVDSILISASARRAPGLVGTLFAAAVQEHERATGGWHAEWQPLLDLLRLAGGATARSARLLAGIEVRPDRMRANLDALGGRVLAEAVAARLAPALGRGEAHEVVARAAALPDFRGGLLGDPVVRAHLTERDIDESLDPTNWLGSARIFVDRALAACRAALPDPPPAPTDPAGGVGSDRVGVDRGGADRCGAPRLRASVDGPADAPVLVLGSSLGTTAAMWQPQVTALVRRFRVVRYDHLGHGGSDVPAGPYTIADLGAAVLRLVDDLGVRRMCYAGLSLGGMVGMWLAAHAPERVDRLALLCTSAWLGPPQLWLDRAAAVRAGGTGAVAETVVGRWFTSDFAVSRPSVVAGYRSMMTSTPAEGYAGCCEAIAGMDLRAELGRIVAPTLVIAGDKDPATPVAHAQVLVDRIPGAALRVVGDAAHLANVEQADQVSRLLLEHLDKVGRPGDGGAGGVG